MRGMFHKLAGCYEAKQQLGKARAAYERAIAYSRDYEGDGGQTTCLLRTMLGMVLLGQGHFDAGQKTIEDAITALAKLDGSAELVLQQRYAHGRRLRELGQFEAAEASFRSGIAGIPTTRTWYTVTITARRGWLAAALMRAPTSPPRSRPRMAGST